MTTLKFYYNGIKASDGKLQRCHYSIGQLKSHPAGTITIHARDYIGFNTAVSQEFNIENNSDLYTDYNEKDCIRVRPDHLLYAQVSAAHGKAVKRNAEQYAEQLERYKYAQTTRPAAWVAAWKAS